MSHKKDAWLVWVNCLHIINNCSLHNIGFRVHCICPFYAVGNNRFQLLCGCLWIFFTPAYHHTVKPVLSSLSKIDMIKALKTHGSLMKVESIAECSLGAFCNTFDLR